MVKEIRSEKRAHFHLKGKNLRHSFSFFQEKHWRWYRETCVRKRKLSLADVKTHKAEGQITHVSWAHINHQEDPPLSFFFFKLADSLLFLYPVLSCLAFWLWKSPMMARSNYRFRQPSSAPFWWFNKLY